LRCKKCQIEMEKDQEKEVDIQVRRKVEERKENVKVKKMSTRCIIAKKMQGGKYKAVPGWQTNYWGV
jgi:hypothetical protein